MPRSFHSSKRLLEGISEFDGDFLATFYEGFEFRGDFLKQRTTRDLFKKEQYLPSDVIDRDSLRGWQESGKLDAWQRAKAHTQKVLSDYRSPKIDPKLKNELFNLVTSKANRAGMDHLPVV